jgi:hypothetical protein
MDWHYTGRPVMFIRAKVVKGKTYHQVIDTVRVGSRIQQRVVVSLGTTPDPAAVLEATRRELAGLEGEMSRYCQSGSGDTWELLEDDPRVEERRQGLYLRRAKLVERERILAAVVERGLIGAPRRPAVSAEVRALHAAAKAVVAFREGCYVRLVTIAPSKVDRLAPDATARDRLRSCQKDPKVWCQVEALANRLLIDDTISRRVAKGVCSRARSAYLKANPPPPPPDRRRRRRGLSRAQLALPGDGD